MTMKSVQGALLEQIDSALAILQHQRISSESIHSARKSARMARGTLRLLRDALPDRTYRAENLVLRDAARALNAARDAKVLIEALDGLLRHNPALATTAVRTFKRKLVQSHQREQRATRSVGRGIAKSRLMLNTAHRTCAGWPALDEDWTVVGRGLKRTYSRGRRALAAARADASTENLHEWRKQAKYLWHQLRLLEPSRSAPIGKLAAKAHTLSDRLGTDHDLAVLLDRIQEKEAALNAHKESRALAKAINRTREALQRRAFALGNKVYRDRPATFADRVRAYRRHPKKSGARKLPALSPDRRSSGLPVHG